METLPGLDPLLLQYILQLQEQWPGLEVHRGGNGYPTPGPAQAGEEETQDANKAPTVGQNEETIEEVKCEEPQQEEMSGAPLPPSPDSQEVMDLCSLGPGGNEAAASTPVNQHPLKLTIQVKNYIQFKNHYKQIKHTHENYTSFAYILKKGGEYIYIS